MIFRRNHEPEVNSERQGMSSNLERRLRKYGSRGIVIVGSSEGHPISREVARNLRPADSEFETIDQSSAER